MFKAAFVQKLINRMTEKYPSLTDMAIKESVNAILTKITETILHKGRMEIRGFGVLDLKYYPERSARDPRTGKRVSMSARARLYFKAAKKLKLRLNAKPY